MTDRPLTEIPLACTPNPAASSSEMSKLPSGTVTCLFTDIEGSTRLLHELGPDRYARALADHRARLREAFAHQGGVEVDTQGDAFFVAFPTAPGRSPHRALSTVGETSHCAAPLR
jgi:class 3 adenylate cyclase